MDLLVREAEPADAGFVASLLADLGYPVSSEFAAERLAHFESDPASLVQLAEAEGTVIGLVATHVVPRLERELSSCRIVDLVVAANRRRAGVGRALLRAAEAEARRHDCRRLDLASGEWRADAHAFYDQMGFQTRARSYVRRLS
jgi:GNAT superfamily N-acetyltransferase